MKKNNLIIGSLTIIICLILLVPALIIMGTRSYASRQIVTLSAIFSELREAYPDEEQNILEIIKNNANSVGSPDKDDSLLSSYGYEEKDFVRGYEELFIVSASVVILFFIATIIAIVYIINRIHKKRIREITDYLSRLNSGKEVSLLGSKHDQYAGLEDEIYKTVTYLKQMKEEAVIKQQNYADNLANIAHQMKTPLTSISLLAQDMENGDRIMKQTARLTGMEEALLLLTQIDAGTITMEKEQVDVYTMLQCAVDTLEELSASKHISIHLESKSAICYTGDMEWSIEASINLIKNCIEYAESKIYIDYSSNPLYVEIVIQDDGAGFDSLDIPYIFNRFYTGKRTAAGGVGIGLALSKELFEMQNGVIEASNNDNGGACYKIRIYSH